MDNVWVLHTFVSKFQKSELEEVYRQLKEMVANLQGQGQRHDRPKVTITSWEDEVKYWKSGSAYGSLTLTEGDSKKCSNVWVLAAPSRKGLGFKPICKFHWLLYLCVGANEPFTLKSTHASSRWNLSDESALCNFFRTKGKQTNQMRK